MTASSDSTGGSGATDDGPSQMNDGPTQMLVIVRHGSTEWSRNGRHTGRTDLPLDDGGRAEAIALGDRLGAYKIRRVLCSPLSRARETCALAGFADQVEYRDDLLEWSYGSYEGRTTHDIRNERPGWDLFTDGCPDGEHVEDVAKRVDRFLYSLELAPEGHGATCVFAHSHLLRVLGVRYVGFAPEHGRQFVLDAASISVLGFTGYERVIRSWNT